ncbi:UbiD family decarboxylase [Chloroflexota bacterium]
MAFNDVRKFIEVIERSGDLVRIKDEVNWDEEAAAIGRAGCEMQGPAFLMENIKDYPGHSMLTSPLATWRRVAILLGLNPNTKPKVIIEEVSRRLEKRIKPVLVDKGPCQENVVMGDDVDLMAFPAPMIHKEDGGRYIGSWTSLVTKDPDTGWVNWGMYRAMIHNEKNWVGLIVPHADAGRVFFSKYVPRNRPMPYALVIGADPITAFLACTLVDVGVDEADLAGALMGEPIPLVKCKTVDLEVPAYSEVVLEGELLPDVYAPEGPFGEYAGFSSAPRMLRLVSKVNCITYRNNPVHSFVSLGTPVTDSNIVNGGIGKTLLIKKLLLEQGIPIKDVFVPPEAAGLLTIVSTHTPFPGLANRIGNIIFGGARVSAFMPHVIVVGPEIDPFDLNKVIHAFATQCHPGRGISIRNREMLIPLIPFLSPEEIAWQLGSKAVYDCTFPVEWKKETEVPIRADFRTCYSKEAQERALQILSQHGLKPE